MRRAQTIQAGVDLDDILANPVNRKGAAEHPKVFSVPDLLALEVPAPSMLIDQILPAASATLMVGASKNGKTLLAGQTGIAVAGGYALCGYYPVLSPGPVLMLEADDPRGAASFKEILRRSPVPVANIPFFLVDKVPFSFGLPFIDWLEGEIRDRHLQLCILDSYTALRTSRTARMDIVKAEQSDLSLLDDLAKRTNCAIVIIHHSSKGSAGLDWSEQAAGTFAMGMATEAQIHVSRFSELEANAPERLVRVRGRHTEDKEMVLRFRRETLDYEHVLEGGAAPLYALVLQLRNTFGSGAFSPKQFCINTGLSRATAHRYMDKLSRAGVLSKRGYGEYALD